MQTTWKQRDGLGVNINMKLRSQQHAFNEK